MSDFDSAPESVLIDFLHPNMGAVALSELGQAFLAMVGLTSVTDRPFRIAAEKKVSKAGNAYYEYSQTRVPLPDGLDTFCRIEGVVIPMGKIKPSKSGGNPTREGSAAIVIGSQLYEVTAYLTETKTPYYIKVIAHKKPTSKSKSEKLGIRGARLA